METISTRQVCSRVGRCYGKLVHRGVVLRCPPPCDMLPRQVNRVAQVRELSRGPPETVPVFETPRWFLFSGFSPPCRRSAACVYGGHGEPTPCA